MLIVHLLRPLNMEEINDEESSCITRRWDCTVEDSPSCTADVGCCTRAGKLSEWQAAVRRWRCNFQNKSSVVWGTTRIRLRSFVISDLHQLCVPGATIWGINDFNVCWWHSCLQADSPSWKLWWSTGRHWCHPWSLKHLTFNTQPNKMQISNCIKEEVTSSPTHWSGHWQWYSGAGWLLLLLGCFGNIKNILGWPHWT